MKRTCLWIPKDLLQALAKESKRTGVKQAEIVRLALRQYLIK